MKSADNSFDKHRAGPGAVFDQPGEVALARLASVAWSRPSWRAFGVTKRIALCRCWQLYQLAKDFTQACASDFVAKPLVGQSGRYLQVRNRASEKGLSLLTRGRL